MVVVLIICFERLVFNNTLIVESILMAKQMSLSKYIYEENPCVMSYEGVITKWFMAVALKTTKILVHCDGPFQHQASFELT